METSVRSIGPPGCEGIEGRAVNLDKNNILMKKMPFKVIYANIKLGL